MTFDCSLESEISQTIQGVKQKEGSFVENLAFYFLDQRQPIPLCR